MPYTGLLVGCLPVGRLIVAGPWRSNLTVLINEEQDYWRARCAPHEVKFTVITRENEYDFYWGNRENEKFSSGAYIELPFKRAVDNYSSRQFPLERRNAWSRRYEAIRNFHFPHLSLDSPGLIAYTASFEKGIEDVQTKIKPGRFLQKFFGDILTSAEIRDLAALVTASSTSIELLFAKTADEIEQVYLNGPRSCMSHPVVDYGTNGIHPTRAYAGTFEVAYLKRFGNITDRALVWPERKLYGRIYGGGDGLFAAKLVEAGFSQGIFAGAKIKLQALGEGRFLMPYLDYCGRGRLEDDSIVLDENGEVSLQSTEGYIKSNSCACCQEITFDRTYGVRSPRWTGTRYFCIQCLDKEAFICGHSGSYWTIDDLVEGRNPYSMNITIECSYTALSRNQSELLSCPVVWPVRNVDDFDLNDLESMIAQVETRRRRARRVPTSTTMTVTNSTYPADDEIPF